MADRIKQHTANNTYLKVAVQWLNLPDGRQVKLYASIKVFAWLTV